MGTRGKFSTVPIIANILSGPRSRIQHVAVYPWQLVRRRPIRQKNSRDRLRPKQPHARQLHLGRLQSSHAPLASAQQIQPDNSVHIFRELGIIAEPRDQDRIRTSLKRSNPEVRDSANSTGTSRLRLVIFPERRRSFSLSATF